jgi:hypothetical protein
MQNPPGLTSGDISKVEGNIVLLRIDLHKVKPRHDIAEPPPYISDELLEVGDA